jgi:antitoxin component YwqK of YwqJK toxin-antitoxin module
MPIHILKSKIRHIYLLGFVLFSFGSCTEKKLTSDDVEYRKDDRGQEILYAIGEDEPFGSVKRAYVTEKYDNGQVRFEIGFINGLKDGKIEFWQSNGLPKLTGIYSQGKRDGTFVAYGKTGELVYRKNFKQDKLDGNFTLYYPAANSDISRFYDKLSEVRSTKPIYSWERIRSLFSSKKVNSNEIKVKNHLRLKATFKDDYPVGPYQAYYHPGKQKLSLDELIKEEGFFSDQNQSRGHLEDRQNFYYPRATGLVVVLP